MYRLLAVAIILLWITAMAALFCRDVLPAWTAQDPPPITESQLLADGQVQEQFGIYDNDNRRLGTAWNEMSVVGGATSITGTILVDGIRHIPVVRIKTQMEYDAEGELDRFSLDVHGVPMTRIDAQGERRGIFFPCRLRIGPLERQANLDIATTRMIGEALRPFAFLPELRVGQAWRMQILDPISAVMSRSADFRSLVVRVTGKETIEHDGDAVECFVVETWPEQVKAWVDAQGRVLRQEVQMPGLGHVTVKQEPFEQRALIDARQRVPSQSLPGQNGDDEDDKRTG